MTTNFTDLDLSRHHSGLAEGEDSTGRLAKQKDEIAHKVADAAEEIERLRMRQEELEYEKKALKELNRKQDDYERGKKDLIERLSRSVLLMEKDEVRANRMMELLSASRKRFNSLLSEIREIREDSWGASDFEEELDKALAVLEGARMEFNKSVAKIDAESWQKGDGARNVLAPLDDAGRHSMASKGFFFWMKIGVALTLPIILVLMLLAGFFFYGVSPVGR